MLYYVVNPAFWLPNVNKQVVYWFIDL